MSLRSCFRWRFLLCFTLAFFLLELQIRCLRCSWFTHLIDCLLNHLRLFFLVRLRFHTLLSFNLYLFFLHLCLELKLRELLLLLLFKHKLLLNNHLSFFRLLEYNYFLWFSSEFRLYYVLIQLNSTVLFFFIYYYRRHLVLQLAFMLWRWEHLLVWLELSLLYWSGVGA